MLLRASIGPRITDSEGHIILLKFCRLYRFTLCILKMGVICTCETSVPIYQTILSHSPEYSSQFTALVTCCRSLSDCPSRSGRRPNYWLHCKQQGLTSLHPVCITDPLKYSASVYFHLRIKVFVFRVSRTRETEYHLTVTVQYPCASRR
jgi:hypothetical protein